MNNNQKKDQDSKKIITLVVLITVFMACTTSATYAYFAITSPTDNTITGTAATAELIITDNTADTATAAAPTQIAPATDTYKSKPMVPQYSYRSSTNVLQKAFNGASGMDKCVDANGNVICKAYSFVVKNKSSAAVNVRGKIAFAYSGTFTNLRWKLMDSATAVTLSSRTASATFSTTAPIKSSTSAIYFDTANVALAELSQTADYKQYWLIVWIEETGADQNTSDTGTWTATITFDVFDATGSTIGGITSTITS